MGTGVGEGEWPSPLLTFNPRKALISYRSNSAWCALFPYCSSPAIAPVTSLGPSRALVSPQPWHPRGTCRKMHGNDIDNENTRHVWCFTDTASALWNIPAAHNIPMSFEQRILKDSLRRASALIRYMNSVVCPWLLKVTTTNVPGLCYFVLQNIYFLFLHETDKKSLKGDFLYPIGNPIQLYLWIM